MRPGLERLLEGVEARDRSAAGSRRHEAGENPHRRAFAGAVRAEKSHDLAFADLEVQVLDGGLAGVTFGQIFNFDHAAVILSDN